MGDAGGELNDEGGEFPVSSRDDNVVDAVVEEVGPGAWIGILNPFAFFPSKLSVTSRISRMTSSSSCLVAGRFGSLKPSASGSCELPRLGWAKRPDDLKDRELAASFAVTFLKLACGNPGSTLFTERGKPHT